MMEELPTHLQVTNSRRKFPKKYLTNVSDHREKLLANSTRLVDDIKGLLSSLSSKDSITASAQACVRTLQDTVAEVKAGSASLGPQMEEAQETFLTRQS